MPGSELEGSWASLDSGRTPATWVLQGTKDNHRGARSLSSSLPQSPPPCQALSNLTQFSQPEGAVTLGRDSSGSLNGQASSPWTSCPLSAGCRLSVLPEQAESMPPGWALSLCSQQERTHCMASVPKGPLPMGLTSIETHQVLVG